MLNDNLTLYDLLDIGPDASPQEVREAYIRTKATYNRDSVVLYTLISPEEREDTLKKIEEAYLVLSDPDKRRAYDQNYGMFSSSENPFARHGDVPTANVVSIDRVPPMENPLDGESLLIPPKTDFSNRKSDALARPASDAETDFDNSPIQPIESLGPETPQPKREGPPLQFTQTFPEVGKKEDGKKVPVPPAHPPARPDHSLSQEIEAEIEWRGEFLKKVRESYHISLEEMSGITKITKTYLNAIEEDNYSKLPAAVYIRGFVVQVAKLLKLPHEKVANAYLTRVSEAQAENRKQK